MARPKKGQHLPDQPDGCRPVGHGPDTPQQKQGDPPLDARPPAPGDNQPATSLATCPLTKDNPNGDGYEDFAARLEKVDKLNSRLGAPGRPPLEINEDLVYYMASVGANKTLVARRLGISRDTLYARFLDAFNRGEAVRKMDLHRMQDEVALVGRNVKMLIHLGVNYLDQRTAFQSAREEEPDQPGAQENLERGDLTRAELMAIAQAGLKELKRKGKHGKDMDAGGGGGGDLIDGSGHGKPDRLH